jgi:hypothetical protein
MTAVQDGLFTEQAVTTPEAACVPYLAVDPAVASTALAGDSYAWLAAFLPPPQALTCPRCGRPMSLPAVPLVWQCLSCDGTTRIDPPTRRTA